MLFPRRINLFDSDFVDEMLNSPFFTGNNKKMTLMSTDVKETENGYVLDMDVPGFNKEDITMSLENGYLSIEAKKDQSNDKTDEEGKVISRERYQGRAMRSFYVGEAVSEADIKANLNNGVLQVTLPKKEEKQIENKKYIRIE